MSPPWVPSMKGRKLRTILTVHLGYEEVRKVGSHRRLECAGKNALTFAFADSQELAPNQVWKVLIRDVGLTAQEAKEALGK